MRDLPFAFAHKIHGPHRPERRWSMLAGCRRTCAVRYCQKSSHSCATSQWRASRNARGQMLCTGQQARANGLLAPRSMRRVSGCSRRAAFSRSGWPWFASINVFQGWSRPCARGKVQVPFGAQNGGGHINHIFGRGGQPPFVARCAACNGQHQPLRSTGAGAQATVCARSGWRRDRQAEGATRSGSVSTTDSPTGICASNKKQNQKSSVFARQQLFRGKHSRGLRSVSPWSPSGSIAFCIAVGRATSNPARGTGSKLASGNG